AVDLPVVVSMTFGSGPDGTATMMGNTPGDLAKVAADNGAAAVGARCPFPADGDDIGVRQVTPVLAVRVCLPSTFSGDPKGSPRLVEL
ncbi:hypothetical protein LCGC14_0366850, partial [marine sediment metagenome]